MSYNTSTANNTVLNSKIKTSLLAVSLKYKC